MSHRLKKEDAENAKTKNFSNPKIIFETNYLSRSYKEDAIQHLMFSFTNKKVMGVLSSEVKCNK